MTVAHEARRLAAFMKTKFSPTVHYLTLANIILDAGWTGEDAVKAFAVVGGESGFRINATNINKTGTGDYGLFQINDIHKPDPTRVYDPAYNAQMGYKVWHNRAKWDDDPFDAWMAYKNRDRSESSKKSWEQFMSLGREWIGKAEATR
jgi:Lysozyme like domain